ncbi:MAG: helix-turn-helix transcriptional regulator [Chitinophagaceae bacterium]|nr:helix-turn-helix transcriptional regulator [Chitinophagaceae bacterium]
MAAQVYIPSSSAIGNYVTAIWETLPPGVGKELILPKGIVEMVFNLGDPMEGILPHQKISTLAPDCFLQGFNTHVVDVQYSGKQHLLGIGLQAHMVKPLLGIQASELKNTLVDLSLLRPALRRLWHRLCEARNFAERVAIIENELPQLPDQHCSRTLHFASLFENSNSNAPDSIDAIAKEVCYSTRQLNRKAQSLFGICTEELLIHKKFKTAVALMHQDRSSLTAIAYDAGFYDQAHFCRVFKQFTGLTAKQYQAQKTDLPFHIYA